MSFHEGNDNQIMEHDTCPRSCRALWCAVIQEQLRLAQLPDRGDNFARPLDVAVARGWFGSRDFFEVCALAGLDGVWVLSGVRRQFQAAGAA